jgi:hypothetical protein
MLSRHLLEYLDAIGVRIATVTGTVIVPYCHVLATGAICKNEHYISSLLNHRFISGKVIEA